MNTRDLHRQFRDLFPLASAAALDPRQERLLDQHLRSCPSCAAEWDAWRALADGLRRIPTPQPSPRLVERTRRLAEARLSEAAEHRWNRSVLILLLVFSWVLTLLSWPLVRFASGGLLGMMDVHFARGWYAFALFMTLTWLGGGAAAALLSLQHRRARRFA
ncbi:MAG TPA: zf-HC2 domain-containing protein [Verrucomicrobiae bacterium]|nr:zf-HC2 domain-containing protein [Verrucomicrobiae bacterium]